MALSLFNTDVIFQNSLTHFSQQMNSQNDFQILSKNVSNVLHVLILKLLT